MTTVSRDFTIDLRRLRVLRELQLRGTVSAAAQALHLTPSAVSQQLSGLSREVGAPLMVDMAAECGSPARRGCCWSTPRC
jgi:hypothetical protein